MFLAARALLEKGQWLCIRGESSEDQFTGGMKIQASEILTIDQLKEVEGKTLWVEWSGERSIDVLKKTLEAKYDPQGLPVYIRYLHTNACVKLQCGERWRVSASSQAVTQLRQALRTRVVVLP